MIFRLTVTSVSPSVRIFCTHHVQLWCKKADNISLTQIQSSEQVTANVSMDDLIDCIRKVTDTPECCSMPDGCCSWQCTVSRLLNCALWHTNCTWLQQERQWAVPPPPSQPHIFHPSITISANLLLAKALLTLRSEVLLGKLTVAQLTNRLSTFYLTRGPSQRPATAFQVPASRPISLIYILILSSHIGVCLPGGSLLNFQSDFAWFSHYYHACYINYRPNSFYHPNGTR